MRSLFPWLICGPPSHKVMSWYSVNTGWEVNILVLANLFSNPVLNRDATSSCKKKLKLVLARLSWIIEREIGSSWLSISYITYMYKKEN